jgi:hypothetical protein
MKNLLFFTILIYTFISTAKDFNKGYNYFPKDYEQSKYRFKKSVDKLYAFFPNLEEGSFEIGKEKLTTDYIYIPTLKEFKHLIIITSGTHGPEAFAGSALVQRFISGPLLSINHKTTGVLLIHAHNPWGFKHVRRGTENNVNLNRNYSISNNIFETKNNSYMKLKDKLELKEKRLDSFSFPAADLLWLMLTKPDVSLQSMTEAIGKGQYQSQKGINFGGFSHEPQTIKITKLLREITPKYKRILNIDLHTGLGDKGVLHIMSKDNINQKSKSVLQKIFKGDGDMYEHTQPGAKGFYEIKGDYAKMVSLINPQSDKVIVSITAEFGTVGKGLIGKVDTINRLIRENQGHFQGYENQTIKDKVQKDYKELFYPSDKEWRRDVMTKGHFLLDTVLFRFLNMED